MTLRERIETVFRGGTPDAMVWFADLTYWHTAHAQIGDLPERWRGTRGIGQLHRDMHVGEYVPGCCAYTMTEGDRVRVTVTEVDGQIVRIWETPIGSLRAIQRYSQPSFSHGYIEHAVKDAADLRVLRYIMAERRYQADPASVARIDAEYGEFGLPIVAVPASPISELNKTWAGVMDLCYLLADAPEEVEATLQAIAESQDEIYRLTAQADCGYVMICENLTAETMGGLFNTYSRGYLTERVAGLHAHGKKTLIHIDGTLRGVVEGIADIGIDCIDALTPRPVGDVGLDEIRALAGDDILILGGLPGAMFAPPFTAKDMERHVLALMRLHKDSGRFMLGVADQVPPNGDIQLVRMVSELVEQYGRYV
ncbi:MAG: uroporphyrinogen decarboxylase family protein [Armatimonadota bacterium]